MNNIHRHTVQCVLPINLFNEKIFVFIWFWLVFVAAVTALSLLQWLFQFIYLPSHMAYVKKQLNAMERINRETPIRLRRFLREYLRQDGIFLLRLIGKNAGEITVAEVAAALWDHYTDDSNLASSPTHEMHPFEPIMA